MPNRLSAGNLEQIVIKRLTEHLSDQEVLIAKADNDAETIEKAVVEADAQIERLNNET